MSYTRLTISERVKIETNLELDYPIRKIAKLLNRQPSTISRELKRHAGSTTDEAQVRYHQNKSNCGAKSKCTPEVKEAVQEKLRDTWSPGQLSFITIFRWIYDGLLEVPITVLRQKGKRQKPRETRRRFNIDTQENILVGKLQK
ncbi:transposase [Lysinibacillus sp. NPDC086135]|uniref:transposase n=1 Tax=Lysinibacillus sp. NPDC086135 TaxID=3364130 RepID=UPI003820D2FA